MQLLTIASLLTLMAAGVTDTAPFTQAQPGVWSAKAVYLWPGPTALADFPEGGRAIDVASPDQAKVLSVRNTVLTVHVVSRADEVLGRPLGIESLAEVAWAPDSRAFAITASDGGWVGSWSVRVVLLHPPNLKEVRVTDRVISDFQARPGGCPEEVPNVGAVGWLSPDTILLVAEAPPHSSCRDMGAIRGYEVAVPSGRILRKHDAASLRRCCESLLGSRLR